MIIIILHQYIVFTKYRQNILVLVEEIVKWRQIVTRDCQWSPIIRHCPSLIQANSTSKLQKYTSIQAYKHTSIQAYKYTSIQVYTHHSANLDKFEAWKSYCQFTLDKGASNFVPSFTPPHMFTDTVVPDPQSTGNPSTWPLSVRLCHGRWVIRIT